MLTVTVSGLEDVKRQLWVLSDAKIQSAARMALNRTAAKAKTEIDRAVRERYAVNASEVRNSVDIIQARGGKLEARLDVFGSPKRRGRSANVIRFLERKVTLAEARRRKKAGTEQQLRFRFLRGGALKTIEGAFIGNKGRTVFRRTGKGRLPIEPVQVIGISGMFSYEPIKRRVLKRIQDELGVEFQRALQGKVDGYL